MLLKFKINSYQHYHLLKPLLLLNAPIAGKHLSYISKARGDCSAHILNVATKSQLPRSNFSFRVLSHVQKCCSIFILL